MIRVSFRASVWIGVLIAACVAQGQAPEQQVASGEKSRSLSALGMTTGGSVAAATGSGQASGEKSRSLAELGMTTRGGVAVPRLIKFSGVLKDPTGQPKTGVVGVTFAVYGDQEGGTPLWLETQNVQLDEEGRYTVLLGANSNEGVPMDVFTRQWRVQEKADSSTTLGMTAGGAGQARWLGVEAQDIQQTARVVLVSVPYALKAADAETLGGMPASAFALANSQASEEKAGSSTTLGMTTGGGGASPAPTQAGAGGASPAPTKVKAKASTTVARNAATSGSDNDFVPKYDLTGSLVPSAIFEVNGNVGIGTTNPLSALHVIGDTVRVNSATTAQVQVSGAASSGRFGQDLLGTFLASDSSGSSLRFLTSKSNLKEWMRIGSTGSVNIGSAQLAQNGEAVFAPDNLDIVHSIIGQAGSQYHFRLSRATPDLYGFKDFLITPYTYGMAIEYPGTLEVWSGNFSVHMNPSCPVSSLCGPGANFWVGDEIDSGGLYVTARNNSGGTSSDVILAADRFTHASHGSLNFVVRNATDAFRFDVGAYGSEVMKGQISGTASASSLDLFSGTVQARVRAQSGLPVGAGAGGVGLGSTSNDALSFFTNNGAAQATLFPSGNFSIGNSSDKAPLAVGTAAQFQVSPAGAATIGGGTAITRHLSVSATLSFPQFAAGSCKTLSVTVPGAADGDSVALGIPNALAAINGLTWFGWVSAPDTVSVRGCNVTSGAVPAPPAANVRVDVWQH